MRRAVAVATIAMSLAAAACGGGDPTSYSPRSNNGPITTTNPPPLDGTLLSVAQEFWHSGYRVELASARVWTSETFLTNRTSHWLTLRGDFENLGGDVASFEPAMAIVESGVFYEVRQGDAPRVLPESSAIGELTFLIPENIDLTAAELLVGAEGESQARVPLGVDGTAVRLKPSDLAISGKLTMELIDIEVTAASLRYDIPTLHRQLALDERELTLYFDVTSRKPGEKQITVDNLSLVLSDGTSVVPAGGALGRVPGADEGVSTAGLSVRFILDDKAAGDFTLRFTPGSAFVAEDGITEATFDFSL